jgi:hypothetical protein
LAVRKQEQGKGPGMSGAFVFRGDHGVAARLEQPETGHFPRQIPQ